MPKLRQPKENPENPELEEEKQLTLEGGEAPDKTKEPQEEAVIVVDEPQEEDASLALKKQIEELQKSEKIQRDRAEQASRAQAEAEKRWRDSQAESVKYQKETLQSQAEAIDAALAAAKAEGEKAQLDIQNAVEIGDNKAQADAYRRLARAEANLARLEDGKTEIEARQKVPPASEQQPQQQANGLPERAQAWLRAHPEYLSDTRKNAKINALHWDILDEGLEPFSDSYITRMEEKLGMREAPQQQQQQRQPENQPQQRNSIVSAPVSREIASSTTGKPSGSRITLTAGQKEAAKLAGITEVEYAKQLQKINEMKANGSFGGQP